MSRLLSECMKKIRCKYWLREREWPKRTSFLNNTNGWLFCLFKLTFSKWLVLFSTHPRGLVTVIREIQSYHLRPVLWMVASKQNTCVLEAKDIYTISKQNTSVQTRFNLHHLNRQENILVKFCGPGQWD